MQFDTLEPRVLFAGVTILAHGLDGNIDGWIAGAADAIQKEAGGTSAASQYVMTVGKSGSSIVVQSLTLESGNIPLDQTTAGEAIIKLDWSSISGADQNTGPVAAAVVNYLTTHHNGLPDFTGLPIHLIGHSKGGSLVSEMSRDFGIQGIWVDQLTALDPVGGTEVDIPFIGKQVFGDPLMASYDNVLFVDDYYQTGGQPSGQSFAGAHVTSLNGIVTDSYLYGAHNGVTAYYDGTIDPTMTNAAGMPIDTSWYGNTPSQPARTQTGFVFSALAGGTRPADGLSSAFGGSASRVAAGQTGSQWANVITPSIVGGDSLTTTQLLTLKATYDDRDSGATITFFIDTDRNPLDGNSGVFGSKSLASASGPTSISMTGTTPDLAPGQYFLAAKISDAAGHVRYAYGDALTVAAPNFASVANNGVVNVAGTPGNDLFHITQATLNSQQVLQITRNGVTQSLSAAGVTYINLDTGDGDDTLTADPSSPPIYAFGGNGNDSLSGGGASDTLTGGAGRNTLVGNDGDDRLNGSGGRDLIQGSGGNDRLYGNAGNDTLDGGGGVDRLFGGDGDDLLYGGGSNDKLYGEAGADTFVGQGGNDLFGDVDINDSIVSDLGDSIVNATPPPI
jgi:Ca2+-binding RTX toxin-like protein